MKLTKILEHFNIRYEVYVDKHGNKSIGLIPECPDFDYIKDVRYPISWSGVIDIKCDLQCRFQEAFTNYVGDENIEINIDGSEAIPDPLYEREYQLEKIQKTGLDVILKNILKSIEELQPRISKLLLTVNKAELAGIDMSFKKISFSYEANEYDTVWLFKGNSLLFFPNDRDEFFIDIMGKVSNERTYNEDDIYENNSLLPNELKNCLKAKTFDLENEDLLKDIQNLENFEKAFEKLEKEIYDYIDKQIDVISKLIERWGSKNETRIY